MNGYFFSEIGRKMIHIIILIALVLFFAIKNQAGQQAAFLFLVTVLVIFLILEYFRLELNIKIPVLHKFIRPKDEYRHYGVIFFLLSIFKHVASPQKGWFSF